MSAVTDSLTVPFRGNALAVNATSALLVGALLFFMARIGPLALFGLPALLILVPWFLKYCLVVGQQAAYGRREPPNLSLENLNPLEIQPIGLAAGLVGLYLLLAHALGSTAATVGLALVAPAAIAVLVVEERAIDALNPATLARYVAGLGLAYPALAAVLGVALWLCILAIGSGPGTLVTVFVLQSVLIATFHGVGRLLLAREHAIGYARPETPAERAERYADQDARRAFDAVLSDAYQLAEADKPERSLETLLAHIRDHGDDPALYAAILERALAWPDRTVGLALARHHVARLQQLGDDAHALEVFLRAFELEPVVRPIGEEATLRLARWAREGNRADVALALVGDFEERFPESRFRPVALAEQARLLFAERGDANAAAQVLERLARDHPSVMARDNVQRLRDRVQAACAAE